MKKNKIYKTVLGAVLAGAFSVSATGCGGSAVTYADGTYTGRSSVYIGDEEVDAGNGYGEVTITIKDGAITACTYLTYEEDGTLKGEDYGMENGEIINRDYYNKAQKANAARDQYAAMLVENGGLSGVDAISGATINYNEFVEAAEAALEQAKQ